MTHEGTGGPHNTGDAARPPEPWPRPGVTVGRYLLLERLGEGGFGEVWAADQPAPMRRRVAVKLIKPGMDSRAVIARFEAERQALALMDHPNIARVFDGGIDDAGRSYFVMELVRGVPLTQFCDDRAMGPRERLRLFIGVCQGTQHAHQKGVIHRDLKPSNILVAERDGSGLPKIIDFGIAKATAGHLTDRTVYTRSGQLIGTPEYMSPEQADAGGIDIDTRTDVYSLGAVLYELLTGTQPFDPQSLHAKSLDEVHRVIRDVEPPRPSLRLASGEYDTESLARRLGTDAARLRRTLRGELDWIVLRAMEKDRNRRYPTAAALAEDIERYLDGLPVLAGPPGAMYRLKKFVRRNGVAVATGLGIVLLLAGATTATSLASVWALRERGVAREAQTRTQAALNQVEQQAASLSRLAYVNLIANAGATLARGEPERAAELLNACPTPERGWEWTWLHAAASSVPQTVGVELPGTVRTAAVTGDGRVVLGGPYFEPTPGGYVIIADAATGAIAARADPFRFRTERVAVSPDGRMIASTGDAYLRLLDGATGAVTGEYGGLGNPLLAAAFSPDGQRVAVAGMAGERAEVHVLGPGPDAPVLHARVPAPPGGRVEGLTWSKDPSGDGSLVLGVSAPDGNAPGVLWAWRPGEPELAKVVQLDADATGDPVASPGRPVVAVPVGDQVRLFDTRTLEVVMTLATGTGSGAGNSSGAGPGARTAVAFDRMGLLLATATVGRLRVWNAHTGELLGEAAGPMEPVAASFDASSRAVTVASMGGRVASIRVEDLARTATVRADARRVVGLGFVDAERMVTGGADGAVRVWRTTTGELEADLGVGAFRDAGGGEHGEAFGRLQDVGHPLAFGRLQAFAFDRASGVAAMAGLGAIGVRRLVVDAPGSAARSVAGASEPVRTLEESGQCIAVAVAPGGARVAGGRGSWEAEVLMPGDIGLWDASTGVRLWLADGLGNSVADVRFSPDGSRLAAIELGEPSRGFEVGVIDAATGAWVWRERGPVGARGRSVSFSPDGARVYTGDLSGRLTVRDAATGAELRATVLTGERLRSIAPTPDGKRLLVLAQGSAALVVSEGTLELLSRVGPSVSGYVGAWSEGGELLAVGGDTGLVTLMSPVGGLGSVRERAALASRRAGAAARAAEAHEATGSSIAALDALSGGVRMDRDERAAAVDAARALDRPGTLNRLAWSMVRYGPVETSDAERAAELARRAVELAPRARDLRNTLGVALFRGGRATEALELFERGIREAEEAGAVVLPGDLLFAAMASHAVGRPGEQSRALLDRAVAELFDAERSWLRFREGTERYRWDEFARHTAEAAAVLGVTVPEEFAGYPFGSLPLPVPGR